MKCQINGAQGIRFISHSIPSKGTNYFYSSRIKENNKINEDYFQNKVRYLCG